MHGLYALTYTKEGSRKKQRKRNINSDDITDRKKSTQPQKIIPPLDLQLFKNVIAYVPLNESEILIQRTKLPTGESLLLITKNKYNLKAKWEKKF